MGLTPPTDMDDLFYFTNRTIGGGRIRAWVYRPPAPSGKGKLGKPVDPKTGKVKKRSPVYVDEVGTEYPCDEINPTLDVEVEYTCPFCSHKGEATTPYKRKKWQGVDAYVFACGGCGEKIGITKKMKDPKKSKK